MNASWRLNELLRSRRGGSLSIQPWPDSKKCVVLKPFLHRGQQLRSRDFFKRIDADVIELEAAEAKDLQGRGLIAAHPAADRLRCGPEQITGWRPWAKSYSAASTDWQGRDLTGFDDCLVRISCIAGATQLCSGLTLSAGEEPIYFPFGLIRAIGGYYCEDDVEQRGTLKIHLDEMASEVHRCF
jgi:hypothetical protein